MPNDTFNEVAAAHVDTADADMDTHNSIRSPATGSDIQPAIDALAADGGGTVHLRNQTYTLTSTLTLADEVEIRGCGPQTILWADAGLDADVVHFPDTTSRAGLANLKIDGNGANNSTGSCVNFSGYGWRNYLARVNLNNPVDSGVYGDGGGSGSYAYETMLYNVRADGGSGPGFNMTYMADTMAVNPYAEGFGGVGIKEAGFGNTYIHAHCYDSAQGLYVSAGARDNSFVAPHFENNLGHGANIKGQRISLTTPYAFENSQSSAGTDSGVVLDGATDCSVLGGVFGNFGSTNYQNYGVEFLNSPDYNIVTNNRLISHATGGTGGTAGANSVVTNNITR